MSTPQIDRLLAKTFVAIEGHFAAAAAAKAPAPATWFEVAHVADQAVKETIDANVASGIDDEADMGAYLAVTAELEPVTDDDDYDYDDDPRFYNFLSLAHIERKRIELELGYAATVKLKDLYEEATADRQDDYVLDVARRVLDVLKGVDKSAILDGRHRHETQIRVLENSIANETPQITAVRLTNSAQWLNVLPKLVGRPILDKPFSETDLAKEVSYVLVWKRSEQELGRDRTSAPAPSF